MTEPTTGIAALEEAIAVCDGVVGLALAIEVAPSLPSMWKARGRVPAEHCPSIERETLSRGRRVACERLRPDVAWAVLRDMALPCIDAQATE